MLFLCPQPETKVDSSSFVPSFWLSMAGGKRFKVGTDIKALGDGLSWGLCICFEIMINTRGVGCLDATGKKQLIAEK